MDKVILDINRWLLWTKKGIVPLTFDELPHRFVLLLNPVLYLSRGNSEKTSWSGFQQQALSQLQASDHQVLTSCYLVQLACGLSQGELLTLEGIADVFCIKSDEVVFQSAGDMLPPVQVSIYLKRFGVEFSPQKTLLQPPALLKLVRLGVMGLPQLQAQYKACYTYVRANAVMAVICLGLGFAVVSNLASLWSRQQQLSQYQSQSLLTGEQQHEAALYRDYEQLTSGSRRIIWDSYHRFLEVWRQKIVIIQMAYDGQGMACKFVIHPDCLRESELIQDWLDQHLPGARLVAGEGDNVEFHLSFTTT